MLHLKTNVVDEVIFAIPYRLLEEIRPQVFLCKDKGLTVRLAVDFFERPAVKKLSPYRGHNSGFHILQRNFERSSKYCKKSNGYNRSYDRLTFNLYCFIVYNTYSDYKRQTGNQKKGTCFFNGRILISIPSEPK